MGIELQRHFREQRMLATAGNALIGGDDIDAITRPYRELARAGQMATQQGIEYLKLHEEAERHDQFNTARTDATRKVAEYKQSLLENPDTTTYQPGVERVHKQIADGVKFTNANAQKDFEQWFQNQKIANSSEVLGQKLSVERRNYVKSFESSTNQLGGVAAAAPSERVYQQGIINGALSFGVTFEEDADGRPLIDKPKLIDGWKNILLDSDENRMSGFQRWRADVDVKRQTVLTKVRQNALGTSVAAMGWQKGLEWLSDPQNVSTAMKGYDLTMEDFAAVSTDVKNLLGAQKEAAKLNQQKTQNDFLGKLENRQLTTDDILNSSLEPTGEGSKNFFMGLVKNQAAGGDIVTDQRIKGDLQDKAMDIWTGAITREQFNLDLAKARYEDKTIDGAAYNELRTLATREVKNYQADSIKEAMTYGRGQLVTVDENVLATLLSAVNEGKQDQQAYDFAADRRKLELDNYAEYQRAVLSWIKEKPDAQPDDIYVQSRKLRGVYFSKTLGQIKSEISKREASLSAGETPVVSRRPGESIADYMKRTGKK